MPPRSQLCSPPTPWRCAQALCCASAFSMAAASGPWSEGEGDGCVAAWALSFAFTLLLLLAHVAGRPPPRRDLPLALALASAITCTAAAILWPLGQLRDQPDGHRRHLRAAATAASVLAAVCYGAEAAVTRGRPGETVPYLATTPGMLKVAQCVTAAVLLGISAALGAAGGPVGWRWCLGIYAASVAAGLLVVLVCGGILGVPGGCGGWDAVWARRVLVGYAAVGVVAWGAATVLWPLEAFDESRGGRARRPYGCGALCSWDRAVLVALGTAGNLLLYLGDLAQAGRVVLLRV